MTAVELQRMGALQRANEVRIGNSVWKDKIRSLLPAEGAAAVAEFLQQPDAPRDAITIAQVVLCVQRIGANKSALMLKHAHIINGQRPVREISERQRHVVAAELMAFSRRWAKESA